MERGRQTAGAISPRWALGVISFLNQCQARVPWLFLDCLGCGNIGAVEKAVTHIPHNTLHMSSQSIKQAKSVQLCRFWYKERDPVYMAKHRWRSNTFIGINILPSQKRVWGRESLSLPTEQHLCKINLCLLDSRSALRKREHMLTV